MEDVIVVGGGPTGFINALGLAQAGVRLTVIESATKIADSPRAAVYHWSVIEGLERLGIREEVETTGFPRQDYTYLVLQTGERIEFSLSVLNGRTPFPYNLHLGQHRLAEIALRRLAEYSHVSVRFNTRLMSLSQDTNGVTLQVMTPDGPEEMRTKWAIGADGAGSTVRHQLALGFEGMTWPERFVATNGCLTSSATATPAPRSSLMMPMAPSSPSSTTPDSGAAPIWKMRICPRKPSWSGYHEFMT